MAHWRIKSGAFFLLFPQYLHDYVAIAPRQKHMSFIFSLSDTFMKNKQTNNSDSTEKENAWRDFVKIQKPLIHLLITYLCAFCSCEQMGGILMHDCHFGIAVVKNLLIFRCKQRQEL